MGSEVPARQLLTDGLFLNGIRILEEVHAKVPRAQTTFVIRKFGLSSTRVTPRATRRTSRKPIVSATSSRPWALC